jgi:hypothetical protein
MMTLRLVCKAYPLLVISGLPKAYLEFMSSEHFHSSNPILRISYFTGLLLYFGLGNSSLGLEVLDIKRKSCWELPELVDLDCSQRSSMVLLSPSLYLTDRSVF